MRVCLVWRVHFHCTAVVLVFMRGWVPLFMRVAPLYVLWLPAFEQVRSAFGLGYMK